jgi:DnaJ-class molecular chaperone
MIVEEKVSMKNIFQSSIMCLGEIINEKDRCKTCSGQKTVQEQKIIEVNITPGMRDNQKIVFYGEGDQEVCDLYLPSLSIFYVLARNRARRCCSCY